jgi:hypothetical protein
VTSSFTIETTDVTVKSLHSRKLLRFTVKINNEAIGTTQWITQERLLNQVTDFFDPEHSVRRRRHMATVRYPLGSEPREQTATSPSIGSGNDLCVEQDTGAQNHFADAQHVHQCTDPMTGFDQACRFHQICPIRLRFKNGPVDSLCSSLQIRMEGRE